MSAPTLPVLASGPAVAFLVLETPKVLLLLAAVVFAVGIVRSHFTPERTRRMVAGRVPRAEEVRQLLGVA